MAAYHAAHFAEHPARAAVWRAVTAYLGPHLAPDAEVLELGAAYCHWINNVRARRRVAVDMWPDLPRHAAPGVETIVLDIGEGLHGLADGSFDVVLASNLLEHFDPDAVPSVLSEVARVLRPRGQFVLIQPNFRYAYRSYFDDYTHRSVFTDVSLPALLRAGGFAIERLEPRFLPYSMQGYRLPIASWMVAAYLRSPVRPGSGQMLVIARKERVDVR